jgi:hypothetical protein
MLTNSTPTVSGIMTTTLAAVLMGAVDFIARTYLVWVGIESAVLAVAGLVMIALYFFTRHSVEGSEYGLDRL